MAKRSAGKASLRTSSPSDAMPIPSSPQPEPKDYGRRCEQQRLSKRQGGPGVIHSLGLETAAGHVSGSGCERGEGYCMREKVTLVKGCDDGSGGSGACRFRNFALSSTSRTYST